MQKRCKGNRDLLPQEMESFRLVEEAFRSSCIKWGYEEIRTPTLEYLHLFTSTGTLTPSMLGRVYSFLDWDGWSGERVVLRPDGTIPTARMYIESLTQASPAKLFYVENIFSFEETGKESRERWQCGAEMLGSSSPSADVELVMLAQEILRKLGITGSMLYLSHAGLIRALLRELGLDSAEQDRIFDQIMDGNASEIMKTMATENPKLKDSMSLLFDLSGSSPGFIQNVKATLVRDFPRLEAAIDDFLAIAQLLTDMGCVYQVDMALGKGFEYYTGVIFRFQLGTQKLGGGGRYDDLIPLMGGGDVAACGFALDLDRLAGIANRPDNSKSTVLVRAEDDGKIDKVIFETANLLRQAGYRADLDQGYGGTTKHRWILSIRGAKGKPGFVLTNQSSGKTTELDSISEILGILQVANATKTGPS
jgi:histidyl-tRNA synthetase